MIKKGITLVALVVTIVILLILAGVTIALVIGPNGMMNKAQETKDATRYASIKDEITSRKADIEVFKRTGIPLKESDDDFLERLVNRGLIDLDADEYDLETYTLYVGKLKNPNTKYIIDGSDVLGDDNHIYDQSLINSMADTSKPENKHLKEMVLIIETTSANETVKIPISNTNGLKINWDYMSNANNYETLNYALGVYPSHKYTVAKEYEVHIQGEVEPNTFFGRYEDEDEGLDFYVNDNIVGLKQWGENGFYEFKSFGGRVRGKLPSPSRKSFINTTKFTGTFSFCSNLEGPIPENLFGYCPKATVFDGLFALSGISGNIPTKLFYNCPKAERFRLLFGGGYKLTGNFPEKIFDKCPSAVMFDDAFNGCSNLTGKAPELWKKENVSGRLCFAGCEELSNYDDIPYYWK